MATLLVIIFDFDEVLIHLCIILYFIFYIHIRIYKLTMYNTHINIINEFDLKFLAFNSLFFVTIIVYKYIMLIMKNAFFK